MPEPILTVDNLTRAPGLAGASLALARGEILGLAGASGAGKSTLARCLVRLIEPDAGAITLDGQDLRAAAGATLRALRRRIQLVFQDPLAALNPRSTILHLLDTPLRLHAIPDRAARIADLLTRFDLPAAILPRHPHEISGGQRQRVAIARALAINPDILILDEPVSALDVAVRNRILNLLLDHHDRHGTSMLLVSHDLALLHAGAHRVAVMDQGRVVETYRPGEPPTHPASLRLLAATPTLR